MTDLPIGEPLPAGLPHATPGESSIGARAAGWYRWASTVDHKVLGVMYMLVALAFFLIGGFEAVLMRIQLIVPTHQWMSPGVYDALFTLHGTTMIFLVLVPVQLGIAVYIVPLQIGARDMAMPRLNALSFWLTAFGGCLLYWSVLAGHPPEAGWFSYTPLSLPPFSFYQGMDYWVLALLVIGVGTVTTATNMALTIIALRAPGMTIRRLPLFTWMMLVDSFLIIFAIPLLNAVLVMVLADRLLGMHFFDPSYLGSAVLYQHYFWSFGHPEVYIMIIPAWGMISEVIPVFSRKPIFGYTFVAMSTVAIALLSFGVWVHHMFTLGLPMVEYYVFSAASMLIAVPTGVKIFAWIGTMIGGSLRFTTSMLFAVAFLIQFTLGGLSGLMFAAVPVDWQLQSSYFLVAHLHYVLFGGAVFAIYAGFYYWFPKISGRLMSERIGKWHFWLTVIGFNATFMVQHVLGFHGMQRRIYTYPDLPGWHVLNFISSTGAMVLAFSTLVFLWNLYRSAMHGKVAGNNPWQAWTLEWATTSPPPEKNFDVVPLVRSRRPLWRAAHPEAEDVKAHYIENPAVVAEEKRLLDWVRDNIPRSSMALFLASESLFFVALIAAFIYYHYVPDYRAHAHRALDPLRTGLYSIALFASSFTMWRTEVNARSGDNPRVRAWLLATIALGATFIAFQVIEFVGLWRRGTIINSDIFSSNFFTLVGFHGLHVC
ncbi:MAG TPA: cbb3-type cytochrome c oxidase subunit I, partial [Tepidisphaeraceae bacterium]|nr:cbb3-type cytochrome c oxidase subunit I [Tepidisphaeraceae bacterium]